MFLQDLQLLFPIDVVGKPIHQIPQQPQNQKKSPLFRNKGLKS